MEELIHISAGSLLGYLKPGPFDSWDCKPEIEEQLHQLDPKTKVKAYGTYRFRLADDYPSYYIEQILICE